MREVDTKEKREDEMELSGSKRERERSLKMMGKQKTIRMGKVVAGRERQKERAIG